MSQMFRQLPSVQEMIDALSSPIIPASAKEAVTTSESSEKELSVEEMIREMFSMMKSGQSGDSQVQNITMPHGDFL